MVIEFSHCRCRRTHTTLILERLGIIPEYLKAKDMIQFHPQVHISSIDNLNAIKTQPDQLPTADHTLEKYKGKKDVNY